MKLSSAMLSLGALALAITTAAGQAVPFTPGNLVVLQAGEDGGAALSSAAAKLFIREINISTGAIVQTIDVPFTAAATGNRAVTQSGSATSEGALTRSADGKSLVFVGYNADAGTASVVSTTTAAVNRVVAVVDCNGAIDSTTAITDAYSANNIRSAVSSNGTDIWTGGTASGTGGGVRYVIKGGGTSVFLNDNGTATPNAPTNIRFVNIFGGQLYFSSASGTFLGVGTVGSGLPTTTNQLFTLLPGVTTATESAYDYYMADANTIYVADDRTLVNGGGLQKFTQSAGVWSLAYTINTGITTGIRNITGKTAKGTTTIYATTGVANGANGSSIIVVTDTGAASAFSTLATSLANTWWRGIDFVPTGCTATGCYANCDLSTGNPLLTANDFQCFINKFAANDTYANCDGSTGIPALTANDFQCFINKYAGGCP